MQGMNVIVPLGGLGMRFQNEGYTRPKPFVRVLGKEMILWVLGALSPSLSQLCAPPHYYLHCGTNAFSGAQFHASTLTHILTQTTLTWRQRTAWWWCTTRPS
jgi:hypothetical protein